MNLWGRICPFCLNSETVPNSSNPHSPRAHFCLLTVEPAQRHFGGLTAGIPNRDVPQYPQRNLLRMYLRLKNQNRGV